MVFLPQCLKGEIKSLLLTFRGVPCYLVLRFLLEIKRVPYYPGIICANHHLQLHYFKFNAKYRAMAMWVLMD